MAKSPFNYGLAFQMLNSYVDLKIKKNKVKFSAADKAKIRKSEKALLFEGVIFFDEAENKYYPLVKFVKSGKKEKVKGIKNDLIGRFIRGAAPEQKMRGNTILGENSEKIFIPLDLSFIEEYDEDGEVTSEEQIEEFIVETLYDVSILEKLFKSDYFSIVTLNGWEIGRGNFTKKIRKPKTIAKKRKIFDTKTSHITKAAQNQNGRIKKLHSISREIAEIVIRIFNRNTNRYKMGIETISGIYVYKFTKQRKPNKVEKKKLKRKKRK